MNIVEEIKNDINGIDLLTDWLGTGEPVHEMVAEFRANRCVTCEFNVAPNWWDKNIKNPIAKWIKGELELKNQQGLRVPNEERLSICSICGCCNALAVWVPTLHIKSHTSAEQLKKFPDWCWKKLEIQRYMDREQRL